MDVNSVQLNIGAISTINGVTNYDPAIALRAKRDINTTEMVFNN